MTLSASAEHDMLHEMERIQIIEEMERNMSFKYFRVPHPYFHHQTEHIQCYGMELIDGANLQEILDNVISYEQSDDYIFYLASNSDILLKPYTISVCNWSIMRG